MTSQDLAAATRIRAAKLTRRSVARAATLLSAAAGGSVLAACAGTTATGTSGEPTRAAAPVSIRFHSRGGAPTAQEVILYEEQMPLFMQKYPNIKVTHEGFTGEDYNQKITVLTAGGTLGDAMWTAIGGGVIYLFAAQKTIQPVDPFVAKEKFDLGQYYKNVIEGLKRDGKLFGLPFKSHPGVSILFFNQTLHEQKGAGVPDKSWTLDRLIDAAKKITGGDTWGYLPDTNQKGVLTLTRAFGGELLDPEGKKSLLNSDKAIAAITWLYECFNKHRISPTPQVQSDMNGSTNMFVAGKLGATRQGTSFQLVGVQQVKDSFKWFATMHPKGPAGVFGSDYEADAYSVTSSTKAPDAAWQWVKWITSQESGIRLGEIGGTVGGRPDVYRSPRILKDPIRQVFLEAMEGAQPGRPAFNTRFSEYETAIINGLKPLWDGSSTPTKSFIDEVTRQAQVVLDKPLP